MRTPLAITLMLGMTALLGCPEPGPPCGDLTDPCDCEERADCQIKPDEGCFCLCDYDCPGYDDCDCACGGEPYPGCEDA